jgi:circadian clock protein KaiB
MYAKLGGTMGIGKKAAPHSEVPEEPRVEKYVLRLYVTGQTLRSMRSIENVRSICEKYLKDRYDLEVVDIYQQPALAAEGQIIAAPTVIKSRPLPLRRLVGDFSNHRRVLSGLDLKFA